MADHTFTVALEVPHARGRVWHWAAADLDQHLAAQVIPPVLAADLAAEARHGRDGLRLRRHCLGRRPLPGRHPAWEALEAVNEAGG